MLRKSQSTEVKYLFQNDKPYDMQYDLGRNLLQCGRSVSFHSYMFFIQR